MFDASIRRLFDPPLDRVGAMLAGYGIRADWITWGGFVASETSCLAYAVFAARRGLSTDLRGQKSFYHIGGLTEGSETFAAFALACIFPQGFDIIAYTFGALCFITGGTRIAAAVANFRDT